MMRLLEQFCRDETGGVVDTVVTIGIIVLVMGTVVIRLSGEVREILQKMLNNLQ